MARKRRRFPPVVSPALIAPLIAVLSCNLFSPADSNSPPEIVLQGPAIDTLEIGATYRDSGVLATDREDGDLTSAVDTSGEVDPATPGRYTITYLVEDSKGATGKAVRTVWVVDFSIVLKSPSCPGVYDCTLVAYRIDSTMTIPVSCSIRFGANTTVDVLDDIVVKGTLKIDEGARFRVDSGAALEVVGGTLAVAGSATANVRFENYTSGAYWGKGSDRDGWTDRYAILLRSGADDLSSITHCLIDSATVGIRVEDYDVKLSGCTFSNCAYAGLFFDKAGPSDSASFVDNVFAGNGTSENFFPLHLGAPYLSRLPESTVFNGNAVDAVAVEGGRVYRSGTWKNLAVPYAFRNATTIDNSHGVRITIEPGTDLRFMEGAFLRVADGALIAEGTETDSIRFSNYTGGVYWGHGHAGSRPRSCYGIEFERYADPNSSLKYCVIDSATVAVNIDRALVQVSHSTIRNCLLNGIFASGTANTNIDNATILFSGNSATPDILYQL